MNLRFRLPFPSWRVALVCLGGHLGAADAVFYRAVNLNGPAVTIDGHAWDGSDAKEFAATGNVFENQSVPLRPATDKARAQMIRSSRWGDKVDLTLTNVPAGTYQIFLYVWEDNHSEKFSLLVNDKTVIGEFHSGTAGMWRKLGPWKCESVDGRIKVSARGPGHGAANLSGLEVWSGDGPIPTAAGAAFNDNPEPEQLAFFESKIRPVLVEHCYECHSAQSKKVKGGFLLDSRAGIRKGGDTGPAIAAGDPEASLLVEAIRHKSEDLAMPPKKKLPPEHISALEAWVKMGAPDPRDDDTLAAVQAKSAIDWTKARQWWAFQPLGHPPPPDVKDTAWPANDIDRFIRARLESAGLQPAPDAAPRTVIRRLTYDLTGLPPSPEDVEAFIRESASDYPSAIAHAIDRLLASPAYGERWGRYWLDVVRYADTAGDNSDFPIPQMHRYRDWVIAAFTRDLPYDQFVREQLAGDLLPDRSNDQLIATGYIANSRRFGSRVDDYPQHLTIEDTIDNFGRAFLGLTINCARCHDHKFDPITQQDYYALYGIFHSTRYPWPGIELEQKQRDFVPLVPKEKLETALKNQKALDDEQRRLEKELKRLEDDLKNKQGDAKKKLEEDIAKAKAAAKEHANKPRLDLAYAVVDAGKIENCAVQTKGDPAKPGDVVPRRFLTVFGGAAVPADDATSGRLRLADWLFKESPALTARVIVNRIWQYHFGKGLVPTPNDFGKQGKPPTHPELIDWLAARFVSDGWSIKRLHRLILTSRTWRLSGTPPGEAEAKDATNELLSHFPRRRLDADALRDTLLVLGGSLDRTPGAAHPFPPQSEWKFTQHNPFRAIYDTDKRSVYLMTQRIQRHPYLAIFDGADPSASTPRRLTSTTPLQALFLLNDPLVHDQAGKFANRLLSERADDTARGTSPDKIDSAAWQALVRVMLRLNEFVYLD
jgi:Protein of unknown function (DUF1549)/Protein of unknown function (DUF1553)/Planctomycete cytochrome C